MIVKKFYRRGQTLIEVLIAAAVISVALTAMVAVVTSALSRTREAKERIVAARLAQEVSEKLRLFRDKNGWDAFASTFDKDSTDGVYTACIKTSGMADKSTILELEDNLGTASSLETKTNSCNDLPVAVNLSAAFRRGVLVTFTSPPPPDPEKLEYTIRVDWSVTGGKPAFLEVDGVLYDK